MKYTVLGFQQEKLIENGLSIEDAFILRTIKDMYSSATMEFKDHEGIKYMWINYTYLLEQIPIVGSKRNLMRKIELYGKEYLLLRILEKQRNGKRGNFSYIAPTEKLDKLQDYDLMTKSHKGYDRNDIRVMTESHNKDTSINDSSVNDTNYIDSYFDTVWKLYPYKKGKGNIKPSTKRKIAKVDMEEMIRAIDRYKKDKQDWQEWQYGSTFFNSGYIDYLDENYQEPEENQQQKSKGQKLEEEMESW